MKIKTKFFGEIQVDEDKIIKFEDGIPGFENLTKFLFMTDSDQNSPFCWIQSIEDVEIVFTLFDVFSILPNYNPSIEEAFLKSLGEFEDEDLLIYSIANIPNNVKEMTLNLKAPIIINLKTNKAKQIICANEDYDIKYYVYNEIKRDGE